MSDAISVLNLTLTSGTLNGTGDLSIAANGKLNWSGGTMSGTGKVIIPATAQLNISGGSQKFFRKRTIDNHGTTTWTGTGDFRSGDGAVFNNLGLFDVQNDDIFTDNLNGGAVFNNSGTFRKTVATGLTNMNIFFNNTGVIDILTGTVSFKRRRQWTSSVVNKLV